MEFPFYRSHVRYTDETGGICVYVRLPRLVVYFARFTHSEPSILHPGASSIWHETSYCIQASSSSIQSFASSITSRSIQHVRIKHGTFRSLQPFASNILHAEAWSILHQAFFFKKHSAFRSSIPHPEATCRGIQHSESSILL